VIPVELSKIIIDEEKKEQVIVLTEIEGARSLPIVIGLNEAAAIRMELNGFRPPRPLTHDLIKQVIDELGVTLEKVIIDKLVDNTFHAKLHFKSNNNGLTVVDARPSDSIALAVRTKSPLFVAAEVLERSSFNSEAT